jgi:hypothetical protein
VIDAPRDRLEILLSQLAARRVSVVPAGGEDPPLGVGGLRTLPLGGGARLEVELGAIGVASDEVDRELELAVRDLRAWARTHGPLPALSVTSAGPVRIRDRIRAFLAALVEMHGAQAAVVIVRGQVQVAAPTLTVETELRLPLLARRVEAAPRPARELADPDVFVLGFWYQAAIAVFFADTYPVDFVRHRCRMVARELIELLPDLDPEPDRPAATAPRP